MGFGASVIVPGIVDGIQIPAVSAVTVNTRVTTPSGSIGLLSDVLSFPGPTVVGNWIMGSTSVSILGVPVVHQMATGIGYSPVPSPTGPLTVKVHDARILVR